MGIKWAEGFDKAAHKSSVRSPQTRQQLMQKAGAIKYVKRVAPARLQVQDGKSRWDLGKENREVSRAFVFPGALVKLDMQAAKWHGGHRYCTVIGEHEEWNGSGSRGERLEWGKYWDVLMPDGTHQTINSRHMRPMTEVQNGNLEEEVEDGGDQ